MKKLLLVLFLAVILCIAATAAADSLLLPTGFIVPPTLQDATPETLLGDYSHREDTTLEYYMGDYSLALFYSEDGQFQNGDIYFGWAQSDGEKNYTYNLLFFLDEATNLPKADDYFAVGHDDSGSYRVGWDYSGNVQYVEHEKKMENGEYRSYRWNPATNDGWYYEDVIDGEWKKIYEDCGFEKSTSLIPAVPISFTGEIVTLWNGQGGQNGQGTPVNGGSFTGLRQDADGAWRYYEKGQLQTGFNGLYCDPNLGWWLVRGGQIDFGYTGLWGDPNYGWWLIGGGTIAWDYNGLWGDPNYGWWLVSGGQICFDYTGLWYDQNYGWWLIGNGAVCFDYNGVWNDQNVGSWVISGGQPVEPANQTPVMADGLHDDGNGWHLYLNGEVATGYTGLYCDANVGWWLIGNGSVCFDYTGLWGDPNYGWWLIGNGTVCFDYNGFWDDQNFGCWLIQGGTIAWDYTDKYYDDPNFGSYYVINGQMIEGGNG